MNIRVFGEIIRKALSALVSSFTPKDNLHQPYTRIKSRISYTLNSEA